MQHPSANHLTAPALKKCWLVIVTFPGKPPYRYRFNSKREALRCVRDFPSALVELRQAIGYMTFAGWVQVS